MQIGPYTLESPLVLAPMAGVTDRPFRQLCKELGADVAVSEMFAANPKLWHTEKSRRRADHSGEPGLRVVQIAGADPDWMADAARFNADNGAQVIDINMGCPAKKVCNKAAGSALLQYPDLVERILNAVTNAVSVPVTLKIRTGWDPEHRNGIQIARIAEQAGIASLAVHGRTRACGYKGQAEYDTIAAIKQAVSLPVIANGDIVTPQKAKQVLQKTGADGLMIGRAAQGRPWIFREIRHYLNTGEELPPAELAEVSDILLRHVAQLHEFYGNYLGPRIARKHVTWYLKEQPQSTEFRREFNRIESPEEQLSAVGLYFEKQIAEQAKAA